MEKKGGNRLSTAHYVSSIKCPYISLYAFRSALCASALFPKEYNYRSPSLYARFHQLSIHHVCRRQASFGLAPELEVRSLIPSMLVWRTSSLAWFEFLCRASHLAFLSISCVAFIYVPFFFFVVKTSQQFI